MALLFFSIIDFIVLRKESVEHFGDAVAQEWCGPLEDVHVVWELVWLLVLRAWVELADLQLLWLF